MSERLIRNVEVAGLSGLDVRIADGRIVEIGSGLTGSEEAIEGHGGALIPGLHDHHVHLFALAARTASTDVSDCATAETFEARVRSAAPGADGWRRVIGYHEASLGVLDRERLDRICPDAPARVQHQTGALWVLNTAALAKLAAGDDAPGLDRATGWLWRGDSWLRERLGSTPPPSLAPVGRMLAAFGVTGVTDATPATDAGALALLAAAHQRGDLPQSLRLMSAGPLETPSDRAVSVGEVKVLLDDHALIALDDFRSRIAMARAQRRRVAVHCVTAAELALTLAAFETAGARPGDRIEHGGVIPASAIPRLRELGLVVVTQPAFARTRGDRYLAQMPPEDLPDAWRLGSLLAARVAMASGSDAPYGPSDPWVGIAAAAERRTLEGVPFGPGERIGAHRALGLSLSPLEDPGGAPRRVSVGAAADLVLLDGRLAEMLAEPDSARVRATLIGGHVVWERGNH